MNNKNKTIRRGTREVIYNVFIRCLAEYQARKLLSDIDDLYQRVADMTGKSVTTIRKIANEGEKNDGKFTTPGKKRNGRPRKDLDSFDACAIRQKVLFFYTVKKQIPTLRNLLPVVHKELGYDGSREMLRRTLSALGFCYKKTQNGRVLIEKPRVAAKQYQKNIVYLDECYVHESFKLVKCWQESGSGEVKINITKGKRYMIMLAGGEKGFLPNATMIISGIDKKEDYHSDMDQHNFTKWVREHVIPNLKEPSIIVLNNAPYHSVLTNKAPTTTTKTQDINLWLLQNNIDFDPTLTKPELLMLVKRHKPEPIYKIDQILGEYGHTVIRLPPHHCDLNPTELIWAIMKHKMSALNMKSIDIKHAAEQVLRSITIENWKKSCQQVVNTENEYFERGHTLYDEIDKISINLDDDSSSSSSDDDCFMEDDDVTIKVEVSDDVAIKVEESDDVSLKIEESDDVSLKIEESDDDIL